MSEINFRTLETPPVLPVKCALMVGKLSGTWFNLRYRPGSTRKRRFTDTRNRLVLATYVLN